MEGRIRCESTVGKSLGSIRGREGGGRTRRLRTFSSEVVGDSDASKLQKAIDSKSPLSLHLSFSYTYRGRRTEISPQFYEWDHDQGNWNISFGSPRCEDDPKILAG